MPQYAKEEWNEAEEMIRSASREIEKGDREDAREDAEESVRLYRAAELKAIRANLLGTAREQGRAAMEVGVEEWARRTWNEATSRLQKADKILTTDRYNREASRTLAEEVANQFTHARRLTETAKQIDEDVIREGVEGASVLVGHARTNQSCIGSGPVTGRSQPIRLGLHTGAQFLSFK